MQCAAPSIDPLKWEAEQEERDALKVRISQNANRYRRGPSLKMPRQTNGFNKSGNQARRSLGTSKLETCTLHFET